MGASSLCSLSSYQLSSCRSLLVMLQTMMCWGIKLRPSICKVYTPTCYDLSFSLFSLALQFQFFMSCMLKQSYGFFFFSSSFAFFIHWVGRLKLTLRGGSNLLRSHLGKFRDNFWIDITSNLVNLKLLSMHSILSDAPCCFLLYCIDCKLLLPV